MATPRGKNDLGAFALFVQRKNYMENSYPSLEGTDIPPPFDLWYDRKLYGRLDKSGLPVYLDEKKLKFVEGADGDIFALNFVADAFKDFRDHYLLLNIFDARGTAFEKLRPTKAYRNPILEHSNYIEQLYDTFINVYLENKGLHRKIITFKNFLREFEIFMRDNGPQFPITLSNYILSSYFSPLSTGIMIEVSDDAHDDDEIKYNNFLTNACFPCYAQSAEAFGFKIDKNAPWRLIANLKSPCMLPYMQRNNISFDSLFKQCYNNAYKLDMTGQESIKSICTRFYSSYVENRPSIITSKYSVKCQKTIKKEITRQIISEEYIRKEYPVSFWLNYYIKILQNEKPLLKRRKNIRKIQATAQTILKEKNLDEAAKYVFDRFNYV